jgi:hypothetical protein
MVLLGPESNLPSRLAGCLAACFCLALAAASPKHGEPVSDALQAKSEAALNLLLIKPETALWTFDWVRPYPGGGSIVCGRVNYQDSAQKYRGLHRFFATFSSGKDPRVTKVAIENDDPTLDRSLDFDFAALCDRD